MGVVLNIEQVCKGLCMGPAMHAAACQGAVKGGECVGVVLSNVGARGGTRAPLMPFFMVFGVFSLIS